jgi:hypothetical protein
MSLLQVSWRSAYGGGLLKEQRHEIFNFSFYHESVSPNHLIIPLGPFQFFPKILKDIHSSSVPLSLTQVANGKNLQSEKFY